MFPIDPKAPLMGRESERAANGDPICRRCDQPASRHALGVRRVCPIFPTFSSAPAPAGDAAADKAFLQGADQAWEQIDACLTALEEDLRKLARAAQFNVNRYELNDAADKVAALIVRRPVSGSPPQPERQHDD